MKSGLINLWFHSSWITVETEFWRCLLQDRLGTSSMLWLVQASVRRGLDRGTVAPLSRRLRVAIFAESHLAQTRVDVKQLTQTIPDPLIVQMGKLETALGSATLKRWLSHAQCKSNDHANCTSGSCRILSNNVLCLRAVFSKNSWMKEGCPRGSPTPSCPVQIQGGVVPDLGVRVEGLSNLFKHVASCSSRRTTVPHL